MRRKPLSIRLRAKSNAPKVGCQSNRYPIRVTEAVAHVLPEFSEVFTLLKTSSIPPDKAWEAAILLLKKNHPKKKADLLRLLTQHTDIEKADEIIKKLRTKGLIHIDAAENVRYRC